MTEKETAKEKISKYVDIIDQSDFHIPEFVSGVSCKSDEYAEVLKKETLSLAIQCALNEVNGIIKAIDWHEFETPNEEIDYWTKIKKEIKEFK